MAKKKKTSKPKPRRTHAIYKIAEKVKFRDSKGRFTVASRGVSYELEVKGARKPIKGRFEKDDRENVETRKEFLVGMLVERSKARQKREHDEAVRLREKMMEADRLEAERLAEVERKRLERFSKKGKKAPYKPPHVPVMEGRVEAPLPPVKIVELEDKFVRTKTFQQRVAEAERQGKSMERHGPVELMGQSLHLRHLDVSFKEPVEVKYLSRRDQTKQLYKKLLPIAQKFVKETQNVTEANYIFRIKTRHRILGKMVEDQGIGTERVELHRPEHVQDWLMNGQNGLFDWFERRYKDYLTRQVGEAFYVRGFTIEVVVGRS